MFSIIVPVYKVEKYISRCIDSILAQSYKDFELILVDDGSPDGSGKICDEYAHGHGSKFKVLHKPNGGVSSARNLGLEKAQGEWVLFVDADDCMEPDALSTIAETIEKHPADVVIYCIKEVIDEERHIEHHYSLTPDKVYTKQEVEQELIPFACNGASFVNSPCNKAYRKDIIKDNHIFFQKRVMGEDWLFNVEYLQYISSATFTDAILYDYMRNGDSASSRYIPEQFQLWTENWHTKMGLIEKYHLHVDINLMRRQLYSKVYYFLREIRANESAAIARTKIVQIKQDKLVRNSLKAIPTDLRELRAWLVLLF